MGLRRVQLLGEPLRPPCGLGAAALCLLQLGGQSASRLRGLDRAAVRVLQPGGEVVGPLRLFHSATLGVREGSCKPRRPGSGGLLLAPGLLDTGLGLGDLRRYHLDAAVCSLQPRSQLFRSSGALGALAPDALQLVREFECPGRGRVGLVFGVPQLTRELNCTLRRLVALSNRRVEFLLESARLRGGLVATLLRAVQLHDELLHALEALLGAALRLVHLAGHLLRPLLRFVSLLGRLLELNVERGGSSGLRGRPPPFRLQLACEPSRVCRGLRPLPLSRVPSGYQIQCACAGGLQLERELVHPGPGRGARGLRVLQSGLERSADLQRLVELRFRLAGPALHVLSPLLRTLGIRPPLC